MSQQTDEIVVEVHIGGGEIMTHDRVVQIAQQNYIAVNNGLWGYFLSSVTEAVSTGKRGAGIFPLTRERNGKLYRVLADFTTQESGELITFKFLRWSASNPVPFPIGEQEYAHFLNSI